MTLADRINQNFKGQDSFTLSESYDANTDKAKETIRARIYANLGIRFERVAKGVYKTISGNESLVLLEGDGRNLSMIDDESIDCILTDHPWLDPISHRGGDRHFATYDCLNIISRISLKKPEY